MPTGRGTPARRMLLVAIVTGITACAGPGATASLGEAEPASPASTPSDGVSPSAPGSPLAAVPDGFPVGPGAEPVTPPADMNLLARWTTDENGADVYDFYVEALPLAGFLIEQLVPGGAAAVISFSTPDGEVFDVALTASDGGTQIDLRLPER